MWVKTDKRTIASVTITILALLMITGCTSRPPSVIRVGGIFDLTGATSDVGVPYADGARDYVKYANQQGGINGRPIELIDEDYGYNIERSEAVYTRLVEDEKVLVIMGWGTGDTEALRPRIAADKIPFMSASYAANLVDITAAPYNFLIGVTYSDQMRIALRYILDSWTNSDRSPRVAFIYNDTEFGLSPIQDGRDYAREHNIEIVNEQIISLSAIDVTDELLDMASTEPDFAIVQETTTAGSAIVMAAHELGIHTRLILLNWSADEKLIKLSGECAEGVLGTMPFSMISDDVPGMVAIKQFNQAQGIDPATRDIHYIQGWVTMHVMVEGIRKAGDKLTGEGIRQGLEALTDLNTGGITAPINFSATSHKGAQALRIYQVINGKWVPITDHIIAQP